MKRRLEEILEQELSNKIKNLGFEIEYIENVNEANQNIVRIVLDKNEGSVSIDDCEIVSRAIENDIDKLIDKEYVLEVSSPGLERQLKNIKLYKKYTGKEIFIKLFKRINTKKELIGILNSVDEQNNTIVIKNDEEYITLDISDISSAHTTYDYDEALKNNKVNLNELKKF